MKEIKKVILSKKVKATKAAATHITLNAAVPSIDMATDLVNAIDLINHGHIYWGMATGQSPHHIHPICNEAGNADARLCEGK